MVWARVEGLARGAVSRALWEERTLVKTWAMRGTLHLLPAGEWSVWHGALQENPRYSRPALLRRFGMTPADLNRLTEAVAEALADRVMTREELVTEVGRITGSKKLAAKIGWSWGTILKPAAFTGRLCFGPSVGTRVQFTRPDTWLKNSDALLDAQAAAALIVRRYLGAYGPATAHDLSRWWGGGGVGPARQWIVGLGDEAVEVEVEGEAAWMLAEDAREAREMTAIRAVRLLPGFDQYVVAASRHAEKLMESGSRIQVYRPQGWISPVLLVNGRMVGTWRHEIRGSRVEVRIAPFGTTAGWVKRGAGEEAERLAEFLGGEARVEWE
jgi:hypothetical protein